MSGTKKGFWFAVLFSGLVLGLGWAVRGVFGHEWGAAWAGSMGALGVLVACNRRDWLHRAPIIAALGAIGWGTGGMMSYGLMVASGRGTQFHNVLYGYVMLVVVGGLYGFIGGGLVGLGLESGGKKKAAWHSLLVEMFVCGYVVYVLLIGLMEWRMTPPRHEDWALCLGASAALAWFLVRNGFPRALRVAAYACLGAGFGFAAGNFVQTMGLVIETSINGWNIMEFTLGFGGGAGMAYAVVSRDWPGTEAPRPSINGLALVFFAMLLPLGNLSAALSRERFTKVAENLALPDPTAVVDAQLTQATLAVAGMSAAVGVYWLLFARRPSFKAETAIPGLLLLHAAHFVWLGLIKSFVFYTPFAITNTRLWYAPVLIGIALVWLAFGRGKPELPLCEPEAETPWRWVAIAAGVVVLCIVFALISVSTHGELDVITYERF